ncbi:MAG: transcriptional coactivator p15/PC4 family protein [Candidatus Latescibacterota bacterium]|jgi:hypothetical protein
MTEGTPVEPIVLEKNSAERFTLGAEHFNGRQVVNLRVQWRGEDGEWNPSKKGLTFSIERWPGFLAALRDLDARMRAAGLLDTEAPTA